MKAEEPNREYKLETYLTILIIFCAFMLLVEFILIFHFTKVNSVANELESVPEIIEEIYEPVEEETLKVAFTQTSVYLTCYSVTDSSEMTGSQHHISEFEVNELGWYTYKGYVVLATATYDGLNDKNLSYEYNEQIHYYHYYDLVYFTYNNKAYTGIVLDTCGASMNVNYLNKYDNGLNRLDIFVSNHKHSFGKVKEYVIEETRYQ